MQFESTETIRSVQSALQLVEVSENRRFRLLRTGNGFLQSALDLSTPHRLVLPNMHAMMACLLFQPRPRQCLLLGLGGGDLARYLHHYSPEIHIEAVENDPEVVRIGREYFALPDSDRFRIVVADATDYVSTRSSDTDLLLVDLYENNRILPALQEKAFYQCCFKALSDHGVMAVNLIVNDAAHFKHILWNIRLAFYRMTLCLTVPGHDNLIVLAFKQRPQRTDRAALDDMAQSLATRSDIDFGEQVSNLFANNPLKNGELFFNN